MKRITPFILTLAIITGIFSPVMASFTSTEKVTLHTTVVEAQIGGIPTTPLQIKRDPKTGKDELYNPSTNTTTAIPANNDKDDPLWDNIHCGIWGESSMGGCLAAFVYYIPYQAGALLLQLSANILDTTAAYTLSSKVYTTSTFITTGWRITRDFANVFFILILLFIALSLIFELEVGHANPKKMLTSVIIIAVLINFSLFITQVVIDTSNALALVFYNQITAVDKEGKPIDTSSELNKGTEISKSATGIDQKPIATALVQAFQPQALQTQSFFEGLKNTPSEPVEVGKMITILLVMGTIFLVAAYSFFIASFAFIGRMIQLWLLIIFAPFAFVTYIIPSLHNVELMGWSDWLKKLGSTAFAAPIYFFFILLISLLTKAAIVSNAVLTSNDSWLVLISIIISTLIVAIMLIQGTKYVKKASGAFGEKFAGFAGTAAMFVGGIGLGAAKMGAGAALGTASGVAARVGQKTIGAAGSKIASGKWFGKIQEKAPTNWLARQGLNLAESAQQATFDARNTKTAAKFTKKTKINLDKYSAIKNFDTAGGYKEKDTRRAVKLLKTAEKLGHNKKLQATIDKEIKEEVGKDGMDFEKRKAYAKAVENAHTGNESKVATATAAVTKAQADVATAEAEFSRAAPGSEKMNAQLKLTRVKGIEESAKEVLAEATAETVKTKTALDAAKENLAKLKTLEEKSDENKNSRKRAYLHSQGEWTGYKVNDDATVNPKERPKSIVRTNLQRIRRVAGTAATGAVVGSVIPVLGTGIGAGVGFLSGIIREAINKGGSTGEASAINVAVAAKNSAELEKTLKGKTTYTDKLAHDAAISHQAHALAEHLDHGDKHKEKPASSSGGEHKEEHH